MIRRIVEWFRREIYPACKGDMPQNYGHQAEYDCHRCLFNSDCYIETMRKIDPR